MQKFFKFDLNLESDMMEVDEPKIFLAPKIT